MRVIHRIGVSLALAVAALTPLAAVAQGAMPADEAWLAASRQAVREHLRQTAAKGGQDQQLAAAILWSGFALGTDSPERDLGQSDIAGAWFEAARTQGADDKLVNWVDAVSCERLSTRCDNAQALQRLQQLDPDNAAVWLLSEALAPAGDMAARDAAWQRAAVASRYDAYVLPIGRLLRQVMAGVAQPPLDDWTAVALGASFGLGRPATPHDASDIGVISLLSALYMPGLAVPAARCAKVPAEEARLRTQCAHVLDRLAADESLLASPMVAMPLRVKLAGDSEDAPLLRERLRQLHWLFEKTLIRFSKPDQDQPMPQGYAASFMQDGELAAMRHLLSSEGVEMRPPPEWLPSDPLIRALVTGTHPSD